MQTQIVLKNSYGDLKIISLDNDLALIILSIFGVGWIKLFIDGRTSQGVINFLLMYTLIGHIIHGVYLGLKPQKYVVELLQKGYVPSTEEDVEKLEKFTNIRF